VADPINSSAWTGPPDDMRTDPFTHGFGQHQFASDYQRLSAASIAAERIPPELNAARAWAGVLFISPALFFPGYLAVTESTNDLIIQDNLAVLVLAGMLTMGVAALLFLPSTLILLWLRKALACLGIVAVCLTAGTYAYVGIKAHMEAQAAPRERAFAVGKDVVNFEREDGSMLIGAGRNPPRESGFCVSVVLFKGEYGFAWARVVEQVPRQRHQLFWPLRRADCFSEKPLASFVSS
jgi:hypothetical protein